MHLIDGWILSRENGRADVGLLHCKRFLSFIVSFSLSLTVYNFTQSFKLCLHGN